MREEESSEDKDEVEIVEQGHVRPRDQREEDSGGSSPQPSHKMPGQQPDDASSEGNESLRAMREDLMKVEVREFIDELERVKTFKTSNHRRRRTMPQGRRKAAAEIYSPPRIIKTAEKWS